MVKLFSRHRVFPDPDVALRAYLAVYFVLTAVLWAGGWDWLAPTWKLTRFFADDLSGMWRGLDVSTLFLDLAFLRRNPVATGLILAMTVAGSALLARARSRTAGATLLVFAGQLMAYSMGGRIIRYDIVYFCLLGYWIGLLAAPRLRLSSEEARRLPWLCGVAGLLSTYFSAALAKLAIAHLSWLSPIHVGTILHTARFRFEMGVAPISPPGFLLEYFDHPRFLGSLLLAVVLVTELLSLPAVFLGGGVWIFFWLMLALSLGMFFFTTVVFYSVIGLFCVLALPWDRLAGRPPFRISRKAARLPFLLCLGLALADWAVPTAPETRNSSLVWPFATFNMFAWSNNDFTLYYLRDETGALADSRDLKREIHASIVPLNTQLSARFGLTPPLPEAAKLICGRLADAPAGGRLRAHSWKVWARHVRFDEERETLLEDDAPMLDCASAKANHG